ncbi:hypothetical protein AGMMS49965_09150 [Bacteroidia bacterium]|nr:hypothetical protein AGMMS49965_09150 [Bacteroidia bacterium]
MACSRYEIEGVIGFQPAPKKDAIQLNFAFEQPRLFFDEPYTRTTGYPIDTGYNPSYDADALPFRYKTRFVSGDAIGIYVVQHDSGVPNFLSSYVSENYANNIRAVYDSVADTPATWTLEDSIYHPGDGFQLDFYAYYPYQPNTHYGYPTWDFYPPDPNAIPYKANMNQDTPAGFYGSDFLLGIARNVPMGIPKTNVSMIPKHAMALVEAKVYHNTAGEAVDPNYKMSLINVKSTALVSLSDTARKVDYAPPPHYTPRIDSIVMFNRGTLPDQRGMSLGSEVDTLVYWAVVPPQYIALKTGSGSSPPPETGADGLTKGTALFNRNDSIFVITTAGIASDLTLRAGEVTTVKVELR